MIKHSSQIRKGKYNNKPENIYIKTLRPSIEKKKSIQQQQYVHITILFIISKARSLVRLRVDSHFIRKILQEHFI